MKTKSIRAITEDAEIIERVSRILAVKLDRQVAASEIINAMMKYIKEAEKDIEKENGI